MGLRPPKLAGRDGEIRDFLTALTRSPRLPANLRITGLRGVGKSVLLDEYETRAKAEEWVVVKHEVGRRHNTEDALGSLLNDSLAVLRQRLSKLEALRAKAGRAVDAMGSIDVKYQEVTFSFDPTAPAGNRELAAAFLETIRTVQEHHRRGVALLLDEAQLLFDDTTKRGGEAPLSMLLSAVSAVQRRIYPWPW